MTDHETHPAGTDDLVKRLLANGLDECDEAATRIEQLEAENKRLGDLYDDTCYYHTPDGRAQFHARKIVALEAELTRANAATAAAYEVAAREVECGCGAGPCQDTANCAAKDAAAIRALATPDQTAALDRLIAEAVKPYAEALAWYGEQSRLARLIHSGGDAGRNALQADGGKRANTILAASKKGGV